MMDSLSFVFERRASRQILTGEKPDTKYDYLTIVKRRSDIPVWL